MDLIVYDVELCDVVKKKEDWKRIDQDWFGCATAYSYTKNRYFFFLHKSGLAQLKALLHNAFTISFNGINFDSKVILGRDRITSLYNGWRTGVVIRSGSTKWMEYDLFTQCLKGIFKCENDLKASKRISPGGCKLEDIASATLNIGKSGNPANAPILYKQQRYGELLAYNLQDVRVTRSLFEHVMKHGWLRNKGGRKISLERRGEWFTRSLRLLGKE